MQVFYIGIYMGYLYGYLYRYGEVRAMGLPERGMGLSERVTRVSPRGAWVFPRGGVGPSMGLSEISPSYVVPPRLSRSTEASEMTSEASEMISDAIPENV